MFISGQMVINARRSDLEAKRAQYISAALKGGKSWEEAKAIGDEVVPPSEFEWLDALSKRHAKTTERDLIVLASIAVSASVIFIIVMVWGM